MSELEAVKALKTAMDTKFATDILLLDISEKTPLADYFVISSGKNAPHIAALTQTVHEVLEPLGFVHRHTEGLPAANWVLMDFGSIIVHIFDEQSREYYGLERIWADAARV